MVRRLEGRGTEDPVERARRLETARTELGAEAEFDVSIVNDEVRSAAQQLVTLLRSGGPA
jgi:guanylate kinase